MRKLLYQTALSCSQLFSMAVILSTAPSTLCADLTNNASFAQGLAQYNAQNFSGAKKTLSNYLQASPNDYKGHFYLANSLVKLGRLDDASNEYKKVLTLTPDSKVAGYSMEAFNKISDMHAQNVQFASPQTQFAPLPTPQYQPMQISANGQFSNGPNFSNDAGRSNDLIPASVAESGATLSPTMNGRDPNSFSNNGQFGHHHGHHFQNQGFNPYMNGRPSGSTGGSMPPMNNGGQYGNSQFGNSYPMGRHHHGRRNQYGYAGGSSTNNSYSGRSTLSNYPPSPILNHTGGFIKNYEITDTPSGDALPLVADQKKIEDLAPQKSAKAKVAQTKKVLNRN
jgi:hypothetical protein